MGEPSIAHWIITIALVAIWLVPLWVITRRIGRSPALSVIALLVGPLYLWWLAFSRWPSQPSA
jgi:hypothetical protein